MEELSFSLCIFRAIYLSWRNQNSKEKAWAASGQSSTVLWGSPSGRDPEVSSVQNCPASISVSVIEVGVDFCVFWNMGEPSLHSVSGVDILCELWLAPVWSFWGAALEPLHANAGAEVLWLYQTPKRACPMGHYSTSRLESVMTSVAEENCRNESTANHLRIFLTT